jgi:two-component system, NarL family, nitrate/nitrite response regulator NarL
MDSRRPSGPASGDRIPPDGDAGITPGNDLAAGQDLADDPQAARDRIRIALIEDNRLAREGLTVLLERFSDFDVVALDSAASAGLINKTGPEVVLLNLGVGSRDTLEFVRTLRKGSSEVRVVLMDVLPAHEGLVDFIAAGVWGFVHRGAGLDDVRGTIQAVAAGLKVMPDEITGTLFSEIAGKSIASGGSKGADPGRLTSREVEIIALVGKGLSNKAIGRRLRVSVHTVKSHLRNVMDKLNLHSRLQIAKYVHEREISVQPPEPARRRRNADPGSGPTSQRSGKRNKSQRGLLPRKRYSRLDAERKSLRSGDRS